MESFELTLAGINEPGTQIVATGLPQASRLRPCSRGARKRRRTRALSAKPAGENISGHPQKSSDEMSQHGEASTCGPHTLRVL